jgi:hypothetical protein
MHCRSGSWSSWSSETGMIIDPAVCCQSFCRAKSPSSIHNKIIAHVLPRMSCSFSKSRYDKITDTCILFYIVIFRSNPEINSAVQCISTATITVFSKGSPSFSLKFNLTSARLQEYISSSTSSPFGETLSRSLVTAWGCLHARHG